MASKACFALALLAASFLPNAAEGGLVAYYSFDGATDAERLEEKSGGGVGNLTQVGVNTFLDSARTGFGDMLSNGSTNRYLSLADNNAIDFGTTDFSVSLWVYRTSDVSNDVKGLFDHNGGRGYQAFFREDNSLRMRLDGTGSGSSGIFIDSENTHLNLNAWQNIIFTIDRANEIGKVFVNGLEDGFASLTGLGDITSNHDLWISTLNGSSASRGRLDDFALFSHVLTPQEIAAINFNGGLPIPQALQMAAVPEPSTAVLAGVAALALVPVFLARRRRGR